MNLLKILSDSFQDNWDQPAVSDLNSGLTLDYSSLAARMGRIHMILKQLGATIGTRVAVIGDNSIDFIANYMGAITMGTTLVTIPSGDNIQDTLDLIVSVKTEILFIDDQNLGHINLEDLYNIQYIVSMDTSRIIHSRTEPIQRAQERLDAVDILFSQHYPLGFQKSDAVSPDVDPDSTAAIFFTSGTGGPAKAIRLSHDNIEANVISGIKAAFHPRHSVAYTAISLSMVWGCIFDMFITFASGSLLAVSPRPHNVHQLIGDLQKARPDKLLITPRQCSALLHHLDIRPGQSLWKTGVIGAIRRWRMRRAFSRATGRHCQEIIVAGGGLEWGLVSRLKAIGIRFTVAYGMAECGGLVSYSTSSNYKEGTVGTTISSLVKARIAPYRLAQHFPPGAGLLELKGMTVMTAYDNEDDRINTFTDDGWLRTGDIAAIDSQDRITIFGRTDTLIERPGMPPVVPEHIELILESHPQIKRAVVYETTSGNLNALLWTGGTTPQHFDDAQCAMRHTNTLLEPHQRISAFKLLHQMPPITPKGSIQRWQINPED